MLDGIERQLLDDAVQLRAAIVATDADATEKTRALDLFESMVGDVVTKGDLLVVLEAMKMETEIRASQAGTVSEIHVREGDAVNAGDALVTLV